MENQKVKIVDNEERKVVELQKKSGRKDLRKRNF